MPRPVAAGGRRRAGDEVAKDVRLRALHARGSVQVDEHVRLPRLREREHDGVERDQEHVEDDVEG